MNFNFEGTTIPEEILNINHLGFAYIINDFYQAFSTDSTREVFINLLNEFETYAIAHFQSEEKYYKYFNQNSCNIKIMKNELMLAKMEQYKIGFLNDQIDKKELVLSLFHWLMIHFKEHDIKFDNFAKENCLDDLLSFCEEVN